MKALNYTNKFIFCLLLAINSILFSQNTNEINTNNNTNSGKYGVLSASLELVAYGRMSDLIEQTGNEDTLGVLLYGDLSYIKEYKQNLHSNMVRFIIRFFSLKYAKLIFSTY